MFQKEELVGASLAAVEIPAKIPDHIKTFKLLYTKKIIHFRKYCTYKRLVSLV